MPRSKLYVGDALDTLRNLPDEQFQTCITSPPYWGLRDYGEDGQLGLEETPEAYVQNLVEVFGEVRRTLKDDGTLWLVIGDTYSSGGAGPPSDSSTLSGNGHEGGGPKLHETKQVQRRAPSLPEKNLLGIPWRVALALQQEGWYVRSDIIWDKGYPMPESVTDRPTSSNEHIFLLSKSKRYYYDADAIREDSVSDEQREHNQRYAREYDATTEATDSKQPDNTNNVGIHARPGKPGRNKPDVWTVTTKPFPKAHFAVYPPDLIEPCILAGSAEGDTVLDPFGGAMTTPMTAMKLRRDGVAIDLNEEYVDMGADRIRKDAPLMNEVEVVRGESQSSQEQPL
jgi:site-specific DNA-methyltransferase (cytosine-N4-specific)